MLSGVRSSWLRLSMNSDRICCRRRSSEASSITTSTPAASGRWTRMTSTCGSRSPTLTSPVALPPIGTPLIIPSARGSRNASITVRPISRPGLTSSRAYARSFARSMRRSWPKCRTPTGSTASSDSTDSRVAAAVLAASAPARAWFLRATSLSQLVELVRAPPDADEGHGERDRQPDDRDEERVVHAASIAYAGDPARAAATRARQAISARAGSAAAGPAAAAGIGDREAPRGVEVDERRRLGRLGRPDDRADHPVGDRVRRRDRDVGQADGLEAVPELRDGQRARDAADVRASLGPLGGVSASSATMSLIPSRPPGRSTRAISRKTAGLSAARLTTQLLITTSIDSAGSGMASMWPLRNSTLVAPASAAFRCASASISSVMSRPNARPVGPTRFADRRTSMPPPEPRSRTRSPGRRSATAVGLPQPSDARTAASGSSARSRAQYRPARSSRVAATGRRPGGRGQRGRRIALPDGLVDAISVGHRRLARSGVGSCGCIDT